MTPLNERRITDLAQTLRNQGAAFAIATVVRTVDATSAKPGAKALILADGTIAEGWVGGGCARGAIGRAAREAIADGQPKYVSLRPEELLDADGLTAGDERLGVTFARNGCPSKGSMDIFVEPVVPAPELVVFGSSPVALALADLCGRFDFRAVLCAPGLAREMAPQVDALQDDFALPDAPGAKRFIVVATQGKGDAAALSAALAAAPAYLAFVGSARKFDTLAAKLAEGGADRAALDRVHAPAGLDIHAITPEEIALSVLAEIIAQRRTGQRNGAHV
ncbi:MAG: xanthine dehydrogenase accessory factor [Paracoccaceae bacterium]|jgi:xanthine dehydrogenase accessory factor